MDAEIKPGAKLIFPDGHTETWTSAPGLNISGEALAEFGRVCIKPTPSTIEIVELPIESTIQA